MKIYSKCQQCNKEVQSTTSHDTRGDHAMRKAEFVEVRCRTCNFENKIHIDDFVARNSKSIKKLAVASLVIGLSLSALIILGLMYYKSVIAIYYGMFGLPVFIYGALIKYDQNRVSNFNSLFAKR